MSVQVHPHREGCTINYYLYVGYTQRTINGAMLLTRDTDINTIDAMLRYYYFTVL